MKRIFAFAAAAATMIGLGSCSKTVISSEPSSSSEDFIRPFSLSLFNGTTKSTSAVAGESTIKEATVFVYQTNGTTGEEILYQTVHTKTSDIDVPLLFNGSTKYTYEFDAYVNMGEFTQTPSEVLFSRESETDLQMHGVLEGVGQESASQATVYLERYAARVVLSSVKLNWKQAENASQQFTLKRIWLANTAEVAGGEPAYNVGGACSTNAMEHFLVSEINQVIEAGDTYDVPHYLYGYGAEGSALVLECEWAGRTMYYHLDCDLTANSSTSYRLIIYQTGAESPLGEITDDALTSVGTLATSDWNTSEVNEKLGEERYPGVTEIPANKAMILRTNNRLYTLAQWTEMEIDKSEAVGVAISDGTHSLVVYPESYKTILIDNKEGIPSIEGLSFISSDAEAAQDFNGKANTDAMIAAYDAGVLNDASAAIKARSIVFANGKKGYLPAAGELKLIETYWGYNGSSNKDSFFYCMEAIGGDTDVDFAASSTLSTNKNNWCWQSSFEKLSTVAIHVSQEFHVVCEL